MARRYTDGEGRAISLSWIMGILGLAFTGAMVVRIVHWLLTHEPMHRKFTGEVVPFAEDADLTFRFLGIGVILLIVTWAFRVGIVNPIVRRRKEAADATPPR